MARSRTARSSSTRSPSVSAPSSAEAAGQGTLTIRIAFFSLLALLAIRIWATFAPTPWLWGLDSLADRSLPAQAAGILLFAAAAIPKVAAAAGRAVRDVASRTPRGFVAGASAAIVAGLLFLPSRNLMLGDARVYISTIEKGMRAAGGAHREPLPQAIVTGIYEATKGMGVTGHGAFTIAGILLAVALLVVVHRLSRRLGETADRPVIAAAILFGGGLQLFAGYPEFYAFALVAALWFVHLSLRAVQENRTPLLPSAAFVLAGLCHAQAIFLAPALGYLLVRSWQNGRRREAAAALAAIPVAVVAALAALRYPFHEILREGSRGDAWLPPLGETTGRTAYGAFAPAHWVDLVNALLLASPLLLTLLVLGIRKAELGPRGRLLVWSAAPPLLFAFFANPALGMARDWDIFVLAATMLAVALAARIPRLSTTRRGEALIASMVLTGLLHAFFWIDANHRAGPAVDRMRRVASAPALFGPQSHGEIWRYIGSEDLEAGDEEQAVESWRRAIAGDPNEKMSYRLLAQLEASRAVARGEPPGAGIDRFLAGLEGVAHRAAYARLGAALAAFAARDGDRAIAEAVQMIEIEPDHPELLALCGDFLRFAGHDAEARNAYDRSLARDPDQPRARIGLACMAGMTGDREGMMREMAEAQRRTPWAPQVQQFARLIASSDGAHPERLRRYIYIR